MTILDSYTLDAVENPKLQRLKERLSPYIFRTVWRKGREHAIPDALSRAPVHDPSSEDEDANADVQSFAHHAAVQRIRAISAGGVADLDNGSDIADTSLSDPVLLKAAARPRLLRSQSVRRTLCAQAKSSLLLSVVQFWKIRHDLSIDDGLILFIERIVIPQPARRRVLQQLHAAHQGIVRTKRGARQLVFWPGISNDIQTLIETCATCQERLTSQQKELLMADPLPSCVFEDTSADLFQSGNLHVLVYANRLSGWPVIHRWMRDPTAREVTQVIVRNFVDLGVPLRIRTDNGPQFNASIFQTALRKWGVTWRNSTPHYPQRYGHAEAAVEAVKELVAKVSPSGDLTSDDFLQGLIEFRNTPRDCGLSPAEMVFGRPQRSILPAHRSTFAIKWKEQMAARVRQTAINDAVKARYDESARDLSPLSIGSTVRVQDPVTKLWSDVEIIVGIGRYRSYGIKFASGAVLWRNRRFLRRRLPTTTDETTAPTLADTTINPTVQPNNTDPSPTGGGETEAAAVNPVIHGAPDLRRSSRQRTPRIIPSV